MQRCRVSYVTGASNRYWLIFGQGLLSLQQVRVEGECLYFFCSFTFIHFPFSPVLSFISSAISSISLLSFSGRRHKMTHKAWWVVKPHSINVSKAIVKDFSLACGVHHPNSAVLCVYFITKTRLFKYTEKFTTKKWKFSGKKSDIFHIYAQNIDCGYSLEPPRRGGSKEYPQSMFLNRNKKHNVYPCKPQFYYIKLGLRGQNYIGMFS